MTLGFFSARKNNCQNSDLKQRKFFLRTEESRFFKLKPSYFV